MLHIERAIEEDSYVLTQLAIDSEGTWGFEPAFMALFRRTYRITKNFIVGNLVYKMLIDDKLIGFFGIVKEDYISTLDYFYIAPDYIGKGYGKKMWQFMREVCIENHINQIEFVTSPEAGSFYNACGAVNTDIVESLVIKGRMIPKFRYKIEPSS